MLNDFTIVLQGYSMNPEQMEEVIKYYITRGLKNIVVSSYSSCINDFARTNTTFIEHDLNDGYEHKCINTYREHYEQKAKGNGKELVIKTLENIPNVKSRNLNNHLYTSRTGLIKGKEVYDAKYSLKCRADMIIYNLDKLLPKWIEEVNNKPPNNKVYNSRILQYKYNKREDWYICDFFAFGKTDDLINYYSIPYGTDDTPENYKKAKSAENFIASGRILSIEKGKYKNLRKKYFCFSPDIDGYWYKRKTKLKDIKF